VQSQRQIFAFVICHQSQQSHQFLADLRTYVEPLIEGQVIASNQWEVKSIVVALRWCRTANHGVSIKVKESV
jgi:hypothetical protein